jgi:hypothetical protein
LKYKLQNRFGHRGQYSAKLNSFYTFGGIDDFALFRTLWTYNFNTQQWSETPPFQNPSPSARAFHTLNNLADGNLLLFGGRDQNEIYSDNWILNSNFGNWTIAKTEKSPSRRFSHCSAFDNQNNVILFGGFDDKNYLNDIWTFNQFGGNYVWTNISSSGPQPSARKGHSCAFGNGLFFVFGGDDGKNVFDDAWTFNVSSRLWNRLASGGAPSARSGLGYSAFANNAFYVFGGSPTSQIGPVVFNDLYKYTITN